MYGQPPMTAMNAPPPMTDPNALLRSIDAKTTMIFHWVRIGVVVSIVLLVAIALGF